MLFRKKNILPDENRNQMVDALPDGTRVVITWKTGSETVRKYLEAGRHMIGDSPFATIRVGDGGMSVSGLLTISEREARIKCTGMSPVMFVEGAKMAPGEEILIGDILEVMVGRTPITIAASGFRTVPDHMRDPDVVKKEKARATKDAAGSEPLQAEVDRAAANADQLRQVLARKLLDQLNLNQLGLKQIDSPEVRETARLKLRKLISSVELPENFPFSADEIEQQVFDEVLGLGPLESLLADSAVTEIMVNRRDQIYVERAGKIALSPVFFSSNQALLNVIERIVSTVGRRIDTSSPVVDARLLDGSRVNAVIAPLALKGACLTIRRFSKTPITVKQLIGWGSLTEDMAIFLKHIVEERKNIMISGGTGSGKTTLLNALSGFIPDNERIITVEDAAELQLIQDHVISLETRPANLEGVGAVTIRDLVKNTLRMRPDRIIVGECRGGEALDMLQAMNTGHDGSMTTAHANTPEDMLRRVETMVLMAGVELPLKAIREQISSALTVVVQQTRRRDGSRGVNEIAWVKGIDQTTGAFQVKKLFHRDAAGAIHLHFDTLNEFWLTEEIAGSPADLGFKKPAETRIAASRKAKTKPAENGAEQ